MKRFIGFGIIGSLALAGQIGVLRAGVVKHDWSAVLFEIFIALVALGLWLIDS